VCGQPILNRPNIVPDPFTVIGKAVNHLLEGAEQTPKCHRSFDRIHLIDSATLIATWSATQVMRILNRASRQTA
jgi:hypothetical protein